jgi:SHS2 domain-containing protein
MNVMVEDLDSIRPRERRTFKLKSEALDLLLLGFLQELIYYKDSESLMLQPESIRIQKQESQFVLEATARGGKVGPQAPPSGRGCEGSHLAPLFPGENVPGWEGLRILDI